MAGPGRIALGVKRSRRPQSWVAEGNRLTPPYSVNERVTTLPINTRRSGTKWRSGKSHLTGRTVETYQRLGVCVGRRQHNRARWLYLHARRTYKTIGVHKGSVSRLCVHISSFLVFEGHPYQTSSWYAPLQALPLTLRHSPFRGSGIKWWGEIKTNPKRENVLVFIYKTI